MDTSNKMVSTYLRPPTLKTSQKVTFRYSDYVGLNPGAAGIAASDDWSINGLYAPAVTGGHQPRGFDQVMALYDHYVVIGAKVEVWADQVSSNSAGGRVFGVVQDSNGSVFNNYNELYEHPTTKVMMLSAHDGGQACGYFEMNVNPNVFLGRSKPLSDPDLKGDVSSNPAEGVFFRLYAGPSDEAGDVGLFYCRVRITYTAILIEPKIPGQS